MLRDPKDLLNLMGKLILIDGHAILHRAYHALPKTLTNRHGQLVNAAYGFTRILLRVIEDLQPEYLAVAFDRPEPTFRHREFVGYQVQRPKMEAELKDQIGLVKEILAAFNIPVFEKIGFEADDLIGTLARQAAQKSKGKRSGKIKTIIVTGDKDIFQLIDKTTLIYAPIKGFSQAELLDQKKAYRVLGVWPKQIVDYKALVGDPSDNYPGVPGIGLKTAVDLLGRFRSLAGVYKHLAKIKDSIAKKLTEGKESALLSQKLARIVTNVPIKLRLKDCSVQEYDRAKVKEVFQKLGFKSLMDKLPGGEEREPEVKKEKEEQMKLI